LTTSYHSRLNTALDAAERVFAEKDYGMATMRDIAAAAGLSIAGLYYYLPSKQRALFLVCERALTALMEGLDRALTASFPPRESLYDHLYGDENWREQFSRMSAGAPYGERGEEQTWPT